MILEVWPLSHLMRTQPTQPVPLWCFPQKMAAGGSPRHLSGCDLSALHTEASGEPLPSRCPNHRGAGVWRAGNQREIKPLMGLSRLCLKEILADLPASPTPCANRLLHPPHMLAPNHKCPQRLGTLDHSLLNPVLFAHPWSTPSTYLLLSPSTCTLATHPS